MIQRAAGGVLLFLHIQPGAKRTEIVGAHGDALKVRVQAPPVDGAANEALLEFLASYFSLPGRNLELIKGLAGRQKTVLLKGLTEEAARARLAEFLPTGS